jgi:uncharacterized protein YodC (DUF2158 family)
VRAAVVVIVAAVSLTLTAATAGRAGNGLCESTLAEWQVKRALGLKGTGIRLSLSSNRSKGSYSCTWTYGTKTSGKILLFKAVDLRTSLAVQATRAKIADELCHFQVACGARSRGIRTATTGGQLFKEIAKAFFRGGRARKVVLGSGAPAFVAVGPGRLSGGAYSYHDGWLDVFACVDMRTFELDPDCSVTAMQLADS